MKRILLALCLMPLLAFGQPPTTNYPVLKFDPATGNFVPSTTNGHTIGGGGTGLPDQTGNSGKLLSTNGTIASWVARITNSNLPLGAQLYDNAGTPKLAFDANLRNLYDEGGSDIVVSWDSGGISFYPNGSGPASISADGNITGAAFFGDGAQLTSLYGLTLVANQSVRRNSGNTAYEAFQAQPYSGGTLTITSGKTLTASNTLTLSGTDGSTLAIGTGGTLGTAAYTSSGAYQPIDSDLTSWAAITRASGFDTFVATATLANLNSLVSDDDVAGLAASNTFTGANINSKSGAASVSAMKYTGVPFAGTGTTSFPLLYINDANATASTTLNTAGTYLGVNGDGTQDLMNLLKDGTSMFKVASDGTTTAVGQVIGKAGSNSSPSFSFTGFTNYGIYAAAGPNRVGIVVNGSEYAIVRGDTGFVNVRGTFGYSWSPSTDALAGADTGLERDAAGVIDATDGNGNKTLRDFKARAFRAAAVAFSSAISSPPEGAIQAFTDSTTATWGATITGGGSNHVLGYYNGTNWTVIGK